MKLNLNQQPNFTAKVSVPELGDFEVELCPLKKSEEIKLAEKHRQGRAMLHGVKGTMQEGMNLSLPQTDSFALNLERAKRTWVKWNLEDQELSHQNLTNLFEHYYDQLALPILEQYDAQVSGEASKQATEALELKKTSEPTPTGT